MGESTRRAFVITGLSGAGVALVAGAGACARGGARSPSGATNEQGPDLEVSPPEDLMREHGALNRLLLIYEEIAARVTRTQPLPVEPLATSAGIVRRFVEDYHEKLEETELFPRFQKAGVLVDLTQVLKAQHDVGRRLTDEILSLARPDADGGRLTRAIAAFVRMYRPHEAREDTVLFPALHRIVGEKEMDDLGEKFEDREHELFGKDGFDGIVAQIATIEQALDIYNLSGFTPS